jgi:hypothetical protein
MINKGDKLITEVATGRDLALNWDVLVTPGIPAVTSDLGTTTAPRPLKRPGSTSAILTASPGQRRPREDSTTRCWRSIRIGSIRRERSGLRRAPSNRDLSGVKNRTSLAEGWDNDHACNESRRIQWLQGFEASGHSKTGSLGWTSTGKNHSSWGHATRTHDSVGRIHACESTAV